MQSYSDTSPVDSSVTLNLSDFTPQHAESEGTLLVDSASDRCSLQPATSLSSLASTLSESQAPSRPCLEDGREELGLSEEFEKKPGTEEDQSEDSLPLNVPDIQMQETPKMEEKEKNERESEEKEKEEEILMVDDQVADFASSMLAAISCWHYRARALLFTRFTTVRLSATPLPPSSCPHTPSSSPHPTSHPPKPPPASLPSHNPQLVC